MSFLVSLRTQIGKSSIHLRWWIIGVLGFVISALEFLEEEAFDPHHIREVIVYFILLIVLGLMIDTLLKELKEKDYAHHLLDLKHKFSVDLAAVQDLSELSNSVIAFVESVIQADYLAFLIYDKENKIFRKLADRYSQNLVQADQINAEHWDPVKSCGLENLHSLLKSNSNQISKDNSLPEGMNGYYLTINSGDQLLALLRFILVPGKLLNSWEIDIVQNISPEIATMIQSTQQRRALAEKSIVDATQAERGEIARDLHDILGQNLSYLHFKLDQFTLDDHPDQVSEILTDLEKMRDISNKSYELVRGVLESLRSSSQPYLAQLLHNQIKSLGKKSEIEMDFQEIGQPQLLSSSAIRQIYFAFMEVMRNSTEHSNASRAEINLLWEADSLTIEFRDNGIGFDLTQVDRQTHFGLAIIEERIQSIGGHICVVSAPGRGTQIAFHLPMSFILEAPKRFPSLLQNNYL